MKDKNTKGGGKSSDKCDSCGKDAVFDEFLNDVENDMRLEKYELIWKKYRKLISFATFAVIAGVTIFNLRLRYNTNQRDEFAVQFIKAQTIAQQGKLDEAASMMSFLSSKKCGAYVVLAKMSHAGLLTKIDFPKNIEAIKGIYKAVFSDRSAPAYYKDLAIVLYTNASLQEIGKGEIAPEKSDEMLKLLAKCGERKGGLVLLAKELEGVVYYKIKDFEKAREAFNTISKNEKTPEGMVLRANIMIQAIQNQLEDNADNSNL
jgi:hypothetical protein